MDTIQNTITGFLTITDVTEPSNNIELVSKFNAVHFENMSEALAYSVANKNTNHISEMAFGNGGTNVDPTGVITYLPANSTGANASLYNQTYYKVIDDNSSLNVDPARNKISVSHVAGNVYTDIVISCLLDYGEPADQQSFDNTSNFNESYTFDELGLKSFGTDGTDGKLLTHVVFSPVAKSLNRLIQIDYTVRIQALTNLSAIV